MPHPDNLAIWISSYLPSDNRYIRIVDLGLTTSVVTSLETAVDYLTSHPVKLVLFDLAEIQEPMLAFLKMLKEYENASNRTIMVAGFQDTSVTVKPELLDQTGITRVIPYPFSANDLDTLMAEGAKSTTATNTKASPPPLAFDASLVLEELGGDTALLREIAGLFLRDTPKLMLDIRRAVKSQDGPLLKYAAHTLKGSLSYFHIEGTRTLAYQLEQAGTKREWAGVEEVYGTLEDQVGDLSAHLSQLIDN